MDSYKAQGLADSSEAVLGETLNIMGMTWHKEVMMSYKLLGALAETIHIMHHNVGFMAQESGYYIDVKAGAISIISRHNIDADWSAHYKVNNLIGSALEHGILEQLMGSLKPGVSTMKLFQIANNTGQRFFMADKNNYGTIIKPLLEKVDSTRLYSKAELDGFQAELNSNRVLILPENGQLTLNQWKGKGYISKYFSGTEASMDMVIGGGYFGGFAATQGTVSTPTVTQTTTVAQDVIPTPTTVHLNISTVPMLTSNEPVDMAGGAYLYDHTDLALGGAAPLGLVFARSYMSAKAMANRTMGYGWAHNYDIRLTPTSHGEPGLGLRQPVDSAAVIAAMYVALDILKSFDDATAWVTASLVSKWAVDQLINNAMVVQIGNKSMEFIKLADGSYAAPPGMTTQLVINNNGTYSLLERFGTRIDFNGNNQASKLTDVDGNTLTFTYNGTTLDNVRDAFGRTMSWQWWINGGTGPSMNMTATITCALSPTPSWK